MKNIVIYINESNNTFLDTIKDVVKSNKCDFNIEDSKNTIDLHILNKHCQYPYTLVSLYFSKTNGLHRERVPRALYTTHNFDNEPCYISITDWEPGDIKNNHPVKSLSKVLFDDLTNAGLHEATNGKNAQWGSWKFAIRNKDDENIVIKYLKKYCKNLGKCK